MELCKARSRPSLLCRPRSALFRSSLFGFQRTLHRVTLWNAIAFDPGHNINCLSKSPILSEGKANSSQESCKVLWAIEADLADGQLVYITGDPVTLGSWKQEMAIRMSSSAEHSNLWKTEVKVPCGTNFNYNYFIKGDKCPSSDIIWRPGPKFSISVPLKRKRNEKIIVRDSWMTIHKENLPVYSWGSWMEETCSTAIPTASAPSGDDLKIVRSLNSKSLELKLTINGDSCSIGEDVNGADTSKIFSERNQPVEEPWLLQSSPIFLKVRDKLASIIPKKDTIKSSHDELTEAEIPDNNYHITENLEDGGKLTCFEDPVSTVILINSSICTMQRIAVLEDSKLVELLLEPVKNNVQCDSVYLGVINRLVPHMGGAFVNIGISRPSLMDIKPNREPFVFFPFRRKPKGEQVNASVITQVYFEDAPVQVEQEEFQEDEDEDEDDLHVPSVLDSRPNGNIGDYDGGDTDFEDDENGHHLDDGAINGFLPIEAEGSRDDERTILHDKKESVDKSPDEDKWDHVRKGTKVIVQVVKEGLGTKGPSLTAYPNLRSRFWILIARCDRIGVSKKISGVERTRLRVIAKTLQPQGFGLTVRTVAAGHSLEELQKDLDGLLLTWKDLMEHAKSAALAADEGVEGAVPAILHRAMGQTLSVAQDYFNERVKSMIVDSPRTYHEVTSYLQEIAPDLCDRVELHEKGIPIFDEYGIEEEINNMLSKRVPLVNGGSLVIEQTEALVSIDVNGGHGMLGQGNSQEKATLDVNLAAAKQIARELRLRDIGGIIVVDFIDMLDDVNKRLVYEEIKKAVERDRSMVRISELSRHGLMEITRKRVRPSVTFMISEPCICCYGTGRVEALETSFSKIEHEICRLVANLDQKADLENPKAWPKFILRVDRYMCNYLTSGKRTRLALLSSSLKVWILLKVARGFTRGSFEVKPFTDEKENNNHHQVDISRLRPAEPGSYISSTKITIYPVKKGKAGRK
ncbi:hypothetical protein GIB67_001048 [Kingdonia uniflora]|uniref:CBM20 domain-containing protein n=1 Tax=Kingdonia uniflora TaxID=39325 RepID=A0A7J7MFX9_9MAGN|nr:hypothetical protein GIB67_001048 [Kingdonia uniflora]